MSLTEQVEQVIDMIERTHRGRIKVKSSVLMRWCMSLVILRLFQAMLNICLNGIDAMDGSELSIFLNHHSKKICLEITDHGCGMTDAQKKSYF